ncbi:iron-siderophore ABC transporter substrate-binding protein [Chlorogloeopsis sp. ULAP01]|uniref:ABC transporter substrate-binding protein n=1 Tax=Chlorogloeopsis sp. ULAP01 TaxID=3056483 RepID=UPI0025AA63B1|nr:iron-siderophore ABC transporter substrate-binding protein [Chlorogloeopsis sp. ULAP01]MDM9379783.1 iron-siderophore ABC transporter substrate-binding protein [Chlorogloeopsis sp. ULAP01]
MKKQAYFITKLVLPLAFSPFLTTACHQSVSQKSHPSLKPSVECRVIQHEFGQTCVPLKPKRIVALSPDRNLDPLIALGIKPIGYTADNVGGKEIIGSVSLDDVKGATNVGKSDQPSLEKIFVLKPDLILATKYHPYKLLSAIAPTVSVPHDESVNEALFKQDLRYVAKVLGEEAKAEEVLSRYHRRIEDFKKRLGNQLEQMEVSVIYYSAGYVYMPMKNGDASADVLIDTGLRYRRAVPGKTSSIETIEDYNTDVLFIINLERKPLSFFLQHPLFSRLKVFQNNRFYLVDLERWDTRGILGANKVLDDLEKYLVSLP